MRQYNVSKGVKGFYRLYRYSVRWGHMEITNEALRRKKILEFWYKYGLEATVDGYGVSKRTLYGWRRLLREGNGSLAALNPGSRSPKNTRKRIWDERIIEEIRRLRKEHPNLGKEKVHVFLSEFCKKEQLKCPSERTIGRLISDDPQKMRRVPEEYTHFGKLKKRRKGPKRERKPKGFEAKHPGHCGSFDTVEEHIHGSRRYVITFTDVYSRFSFAWATTSHASKAAKEFFKLITMIFPYELEHILTDNGSEFAKEFDAEIRRLHKVHWHTYPRTPKMNAHVERFNRTLQEEFLNFHKPLLLEPDKCNDKMIDYLLWYNGQRPHWSLDLQSPIQFLSTNHFECNMWWPNTNIRFLSIYFVYSLYYETHTPYPHPICTRTRSST